jgi:hypothetical protein
MLRATIWTIALAVSLIAIESAHAASFVAVNLQTSDIGYSSVSGLFYASVPNASVINPNTLTPINPGTAALGTAIPIGFDPGRIAVGSDGNNVFTAVGGLRAVQRYNIPTSTADQLFTISGGPQITDMQAIPGRPLAVVLHEADHGSSPSSVATAVYENGVLLPHQVGHGAGVGGPDIFAVDPTNGTKAYGYDNSDTGFSHTPMVIGALGIDGAGSSALSGVLTGFNVGRIAILGDRLFDDRGEIFSLSLGIQVGAFTGGGDFVLDPSGHKFFSVTTSGSTQTIHAYSLDTLTQIGLDTLTGIAGSTGSLTRFGSDGLAFRTATQVVFLHSAAVPEPSGLILAAIGIISFAACGWRKRSRG